MAKSGRRQSSGTPAEAATGAPQATGGTGGRVLIDPEEAVEPHDLDEAEEVDSAEEVSDDGYFAEAAEDANDEVNDKGEEAPAPSFPVPDTDPELLTLLAALSADLDAALPLADRLEER